MKDLLLLQDRAIFRRTIKNCYIAWQKYYTDSHDSVFLYDPKYEKKLGWKFSSLADTCAVPVFFWMLLSLFGFVLFLLMKLVETSDIESMDIVIIVRYLLFYSFVDLSWYKSLYRIMFIKKTRNKFLNSSDVMGEKY